MARFRLYLWLVYFTAMGYLAWRIGVLPLAAQKFMSSYGLHALATFGYTIFMTLTASVSWFKTLSWKNMSLLTMLIAVVASTIWELLQYFQPGRVVDAWDILAQVVGCLLAYACLLTIGRPDVLVPVIEANGGDSDEVY